MDSYILLWAHNHHLALCEPDEEGGEMGASIFGSLNVTVFTKQNHNFVNYKEFKITFYPYMISIHLLEMILEMSIFHF